MKLLISPLSFYLYKNVPSRNVKTIYGVTLYFHWTALSLVLAQNAQDWASVPAKALWEPLPSNLPWCLWFMETASQEAKPVKKALQ